MTTKNIRSDRIFDLLELMAEHDYIGLAEVKFYCKFFCGERDKCAEVMAERHLRFLKERNLPKTMRVLLANLFYTLFLWKQRELHYPLQENPRKRRKQGRTRA